MHAGGAGPHVADGTSDPTVATVLQVRGGGLELARAGPTAAWSALRLWPLQPRAWLG